MNECKHHHFIPKCYLSNFSDDGKGVWVYNKTENRAYLTSIDKIFQKKNWYRIPKELIPVHGKDLINPLSIETEFFADQIESQFNHYLKSISSTIDELLKDKSIFQNCRLHEDYVNEFAIQIAIQFFRTPKAQKAVMETLSNLSEISHIIDSKYIDKELLLELNKAHNPTIAHFWTIFANDKFIPGIKEILKNKIWITLVSPNMPFYTSDSPIIVESLYKTPSSFDISLNEKGGVITYPLTKKILLKLLDKEYYMNFVDEDRMILLANDDFVIKENHKHFIYANNEIVSPIEDFEVYFQKLHF